MARSKSSVLIFLSALFVLSVAPQLVTAAQPRIDSLVVDESVSHLFVYGQFGLFSGNVNVGSTPVIIESWSDKVIECVIPPSGPGSGGGVVVTNANGTSNVEMLTMWICHLDGDSYYWYSCGITDNDYFHFDLYWRLDIQHLLLNKMPGKINFTGTSSCMKLEHFDHDTGNEPSCNNGQQEYDKYDTINGYLAHGQLDLADKLLNLSEFQILWARSNLPLLTNILLDSTYLPISISFSYNGGGNGSTINATSDSVIGAPPPQQTSKTSLATKKDFSASLLDNPIRGGAWLNLSLTSPEACKFEALDMLGNVVTSDAFQTNASIYNYYWNTSQLAPGMYFYRLSAPDGVLTGKAIVLPK